MDFIPGLFFVCKIFPGGYFYEGDYFGYFGMRDVFIPGWYCGNVVSMNVYGKELCYWMNRFFL